MTKKSNLFKHFRELMVGGNQCDLVDEWASELPNRKYKTVGFWRLCSSVTRNR